MNNGYFLHLKLGAAKSIFRQVASLDWHIIWNRSKNSMFEAYDWILMLSLLTLEWAAALFSWKGSRAADNGHPSKFQELTCLGLCWHGPCEQPASGQTWLNFFLLLPGAQSVLWEHIMKEIYLVSLISSSWFVIFFILGLGLLKKDAFGVIHLLIHPPISLFICPSSIHLFIYPFIHPFVHSSILPLIHPSAQLPTHPNVYGAFTMCQVLSKTVAAPRSPKYRRNKR